MESSKSKAVKRLHRNARKRGDTSLGLKPWARTSKDRGVIEWCKKRGLYETP